MSPSPPLSQEKHFKMAELCAQGLSIRLICAQVPFSKSISRFLKDPSGYNKKRSPGRPRKFTEHDERRVERTLQAGHSSAALIVNTLQLPVSRVTMWKTIRRVKHYPYVKKKQTLILSSTLKQGLRRHWIVHAES